VPVFGLAAYGGLLATDLPLFPCVYGMLFAECSVPGSGETSWSGSPFWAWGIFVGVFIFIRGGVAGSLEFIARFPEVQVQGIRLRGGRRPALMWFLQMQLKGPQS
jgi:hypothetical protein